MVFYYMYLSTEQPLFWSDLVVCDLANRRLVEPNRALIIIIPFVISFVATLSERLATEAHKYGGL